MEFTPTFCVGGARYYDAELGRWMSIDPLAHLRPGLSPYNYVQNNPHLRIDPGGLTDIKISVYRKLESSKSTLGNLYVTNSSNEKTISGYTLELPDKNNKPFESRILSGSYEAKRSSSNKFNKSGGVIRLEDKNDRTDVLIHYGNDPAETEGCILVGSSQSKDKVKGSVNKLTELIQYVDEIMETDNENGEETNIIVEIEDPKVEDEEND